MPKQKKSQIRLDLQQKVQILKKLDQGIHGKRLALEYGVSKVAISKIKKKRNEILEAVANTYEKCNRKTLHKPEYADLESKLYKWFLDQRQRNCALNGPILKSRAKYEFAKMHPGKTFNASDGWLANFKKRYGIRNLKICGEILSSDTSGVAPFIHHLRAKINEMKLSDSQLYNADETGLFYRFLPDKTFVAATEKTAPGRKIAKERLTLLLCANADGSHKLKPLVIGKSANPRCFKGFENPLEYANSKKSWMASELFFNWFHHSFIKQVRKFSTDNNLPPKALLLIDNCTAHKPIEMLQSDDGQITAMLLPPNITAVLQPMDQNPIRLVKLGYRSKLLCNIVAQETVPVENILKAHTIRDAVLMLKLVWDELPQEVLTKAWNKIKKWDDDQYESEDEIPLSEMILSNSPYNDTLREVQMLISKVGDNVDIGINEIINWNNDEISENNDDSEVTDNENDVSIIEEDVQRSKVSFTKAVESINNVIKWFESNNDANQVADLVDMRAKMIKSYYTKEKKQTSLDCFFKPL